MTKKSREEQRLDRVMRVQASGWLSQTDLAFHCGVGETKMRRWMQLPTFPKPSQPSGGWKESRYEKSAVDAWMRAHQT